MRGLHGNPESAYPGQDIFQFHPGQVGDCHLRFAMRMFRICNFNRAPHDARISTGYAANALLYQFFFQSDPALNED